MIREDQPVSALESVAEEERAGLIVVGSRGRRSLLSTVLGSTSGRLAVSASRPVLVIREGHAERLARLDQAKEQAEKLSRRG
jgi:nucleotide-binding universal stress UspA family protein